MGKYLPSVTMSNRLSTEDLSHDSSVIDAYENDPLVHDRASAGLYIGFTKTAAECMKRASELTIPLLAIHGKADMMVDYKGTEEVFLNVSSRSKKIILGEGMYHETMNETEELRMTILSSISEWLTSLIKPAGKKKAGPKAAAKKSSSKKASSKKAASKDASDKKTSKKAAKKKATSKKAAAKKAVKSTAKKTASKKASAKKTTAKKAAKKKTSKK